MTENATTERRLTLMEAQVATVVQIVNRLESQSGVLSAVERSVLEVRGDVKNICSQIGRLQKDHDTLEHDTEVSRIASQKAFDEVVEKFLGAFHQMIHSMKDFNTQILSATQKDIETHGKKISEDIEPRLKNVEKTTNRWAGGLALLVIIGVPLIGVAYHYFFNS